MEKLISSPNTNFGKLNKKIANFGFLVAIAATLVFTSCESEDSNASSAGLKLNGQTALAPNQGQTLSLTNVDAGTVHRDNNDVYTVNNYFVSQGIYSGSGNHIPNGTYYFSFYNNDNVKGATSTTPPSADWDVSFSGTGNADIRVEGSVSIKYVNEPFSTVKSYAASYAWDTKGVTPPSVPFGHNRSLYLPPASAPAGHVLTSADYLAAASGHTIKGWWNYYFPKHIVEGTTDLTILIQDAFGDVYALHMISVYQNGAPYEPGDNTANPPADYSWLKFEYKKL
ncbi:hypothetical protein ACFFLS_14385 [Flavobacterium procerum]|uniref:DUF4465 domain-containing protein n=1 Tax=Flavobacterium procerum TaxID=1455569 RepID=A0ABV6BS12_9FLAO